MSDHPDAKIRPYESKDLDAVRYLVGSDEMECIPLANKAFFFTRNGMLAWLGLSALLIAVSGWTPAPPCWDANSRSFKALQDSSLLWEILQSLLSLAPLAGAGFIILGAVEVQHRSVFERALSRRLKQEDMRDIPKYYGQAPASGFYVLDYGGKVIGCVGYDACRPRDTLKGADHAETSSSKATSRQRKSGAKTDNTENEVLIRTLCTSAAYRSTGIEEDLLHYALTKLFKSPSPVQRVDISLRPLLQTQKLELVEKMGMKRERKKQSIDADLIEVPKDARVALFVPSRPLASIWPLDLRSAVWSIDRASWQSSDK